MSTHALPSRRSSSSVQSIQRTKRSNQRHRSTDVATWLRDIDIDVNVNNAAPSHPPRTRSSSRPPSSRGTEQHCETTQHPLPSATPRPHPGPFTHRSSRTPTRARTRPLGPDLNPPSRRTGASDVSAASTTGTTRSRPGGWRRVLWPRIDDQGRRWGEMREGEVDAGDENGGRPGQFADPIVDNDNDNDDDDINHMDKAIPKPTTQDPTDPTESEHSQETLFGISGRENHIWTNLKSFYLGPPPLPLVPLAGPPLPLVFLEPLEPRPLVGSSYGAELVQEGTSAPSGMGVRSGRPVEVDVDVDDRDRDRDRDGETLELESDLWRDISRKEIPRSRPEPLRRPRPRPRSLPRPLPQSRSSTTATPTTTPTITPTVPGRTQGEEERDLDRDERRDDEDEHELEEEEDEQDTPRSKLGVRSGSGLVAGTSPRTGTATGTEAQPEPGPLLGLGSNLEFGSEHGPELGLGLGPGPEFQLGLESKLGEPPTTVSDGYRVDSDELPLVTFNRRANASRGFAVVINRPPLALVHSTHPSSGSSQVTTPRSSPPRGSPCRLSPPPPGFEALERCPPPHRHPNRRGPQGQFQMTVLPAQPISCPESPDPFGKWTEQSFAHAARVRPVNKSQAGRYTGDWRVRRSK